MSFSEKLELLRQILPEAEPLGDRRLAAEIHLEIARNRSGQSEPPDAFADSLAHVGEAAEELDDDFLRAQPLLFEGMRAFNAGRFRETVEVLRETVPLLERFGDFANASFHSGMVAVSHAMLGEFSEADEWIGRVRRLAETSGDPNSGLDADIFEGHVAGERGNLVEGIRLARQGAARANQVGNMMCEIAGTLTVGEQQIRRGAPADAVPSLVRSGELARDCGAVAFAAQSHAWLSAARSYLGEVASGIAGLDEAVRKARELGDQFGEAEILRHRAIARSLVESPDWDAVAADFQASIEIFERLETRPALARGLRDYGTALAEAGRDVEAGRARARAMALSAELGLAAS
jgi:tetratricopeptide (TPR) repeat protein